MIIKIIILLLIVAIFYSLGSALYYLLKTGGQSPQMLKALIWRLALSLVLFGLLFLGFFMGWLKPHGLPFGPYP